MKRDSIKSTYKEYGRGIAGGLLFSLPLLYTMEVWWRGFTADPLYHLIMVFSTFFLLLGYNNFSGLRKDANFKDVCWDSIEELGLAVLVSFAFLLLIGKISFGMSVYEITGKVIVEAMIVAIGISIGTAQLGKEKEGRTDSERNKEDYQHLNLGKILVLSACGAVVVSSSVAPTEEILLIAVECSLIHLLLMVITSLIIGAVVLYYSNFINSTTKEFEFFDVALEVLVSYFVALLISLCLLVYFGRVSGYDISIVVAQVIVLGIPAILGASAARLLIGN